LRVCAGRAPFYTAGWFLKAEIAMAPSPAFAHIGRRVVMLTGAAGRMGRAVARRLAEEGYALALVDRDEGGLADLAQSLDGSNAAIVADLSKAEGAETAVARCEAALGPVDILINNAGVFTPSKIGQTSDEEWRRVLSVNVDAAFYLSRRLLPGMMQRRFGRIVNVGSMAMKNGGLTAGTAYAVSKGALGALTFSLAREAAPFGVTVNAIAPAYVEGPMLTDNLSAEALEAVKRQIPVGRFCQPEEFAHCVAFLIAPLSGFITGEILDLNGGLLLD
jgi:3-oxoacyl-[acyl-carrier protein] reductase